MPGDFPVLDGVVYTGMQKKGPTVVVDGYTNESLEGMHTEWRDRFLEAGYKVPFHEIEKDRGDSEVAYQSKGPNVTSGIVALRGGTARANGNVSIHITNRPGTLDNSGPRPASRAGRASARGRCDPRAGGRTRRHGRVTRLRSANCCCQILVE